MYKAIISISIDFRLIKSFYPAYAYDQNFALPFLFTFGKLEVQNTYHAKFYRDIRTGSLIILALFFGFRSPPLLDSKNDRVRPKELALDRAFWK